MVSIWNQIPPLDIGGFAPKSDIPPCCIHGGAVLLYKLQNRLFERNCGDDYRMRPIFSNPQPKREPEVFCTSCGSCCCNADLRIQPNLCVSVANYPWYSVLPYCRQSFLWFGISQTAANIAGVQTDTGISGFLDTAADKGDTGNKSLDQYSTGRITEWLMYAKDLNLLGHEEVPVIYNESIKQYISTTHMAILQIAYESGIIAGVCYLLLNLISGFSMIGFAWKFRKEQYALMPIVVTVTFGVVSILSSSSNAFLHLVTFYYYCVLFPVMVRQPVQEGEKE